ncbi:MAG: hypothetical protein RL213_1135 [Bacteroidota bacterium]|jgi:hypothetical protein
MFRSAVLLFSLAVLSGFRIAPSVPDLTNQQIITGLKDALSIGTDVATASASKTDGFNKNPLIRIPFPKEAQDVRKTMIDLGMKKQVKDFETQLNRAAEDASKKAAPIFLGAIRKMTISDGLTILRGNQDEATQFLKRNTQPQLTTEFRPVVKASLEKVQITKYWKPLMTKYNKLNIGKKVNPNLDAYVTEKAIDGLFKLIAQEEAKIRKDPVAQVTDILKLVFGGK